KHQCSLSINQREFDIATTWRKYILTPQRLQRHNELVMATWPQDIPDRLPLDGFFYQYKDPATGNTALDQAKSMQKDLYNRANKLWKPVIRLNLAATSRDGFATYRAEDQSQLP
ncbi:TPA: hypothetical protein ACKP22_002196, partial [Pseudomonas putida]